MTWPGRGKQLLLVILLTCLVFAGITGYGDFREVWRHLVAFPASYLLLALGLALLNYLLRFLRWVLLLENFGDKCSLAGELAHLFQRPGHDHYARQGGRIGQELPVARPKAAYPLPPRSRQ